MGLRDDKLVESPKLLEDTKYPMHASTSHHVWAAFCSTWSARAQCVHLHHWWPLVENSALHGRLRVSESRVWRVAPAAQISAAPKGSSSCVCCRRGRLTGEGVYRILSQVAPAWDLYHAPYQLKEGRTIFPHLIFFLPFESAVESEEYCWL